MAGELPRYSKRLQAPTSVKLCQTRDFTRRCKLLEDAADAGLRTGWKYNVSEDHRSSGLHVGQQDISEVSNESKGSIIL
jgi:hypothetical protein